MAMQKKRIPNTNVKPDKSLAPDSRKEKKMKTLRFRNDEIELGVYAGDTLDEVLKKYGRKALPKLLKYYNLSEEIMRQYHCRLKPHKEERKEVSAQNKTNERLKSEVSQVSTTVIDQLDMGFDCDNIHNTTDHVVKNENNWTSSRSDHENSVLYDPEDDQPETTEARGLMAIGGAHPYWSDGSFHMGTSINY